MTTEQVENWQLTSWFGKVHLNWIPNNYNQSVRYFRENVKNDAKISSQLKPPSLRKCALGNELISTDGQIKLQVK